MDLETRSNGLTEFFDTVPKHMKYFCSSPSSYTPPSTDLETTLISSILQDDRNQLMNLSKRHYTNDNTLHEVDRQTALVSKLLRVSCIFDSVNCATTLINGDLGPVALVNEVDESSGMYALHLAAESHSASCVELLLRKRARTDLKSKDGRGLLPLQLSLSTNRMDVIWNPYEHSVEDLLVILGQKDLTTVKLLSEKTKAVDEVAYANAVEGNIVALAALVMVASEKVKESILVLPGIGLGAKEKTTIYESVIREALSFGRATQSQRSLKRISCTQTTHQCAVKRKLLLLEMELLQLFGAVVSGSCTDKKVGPPLILATQAGDEAVIEILLKSKNIDVNNIDADGNSALHCALKTSMGLSQHIQQNRIVRILLKHGALVRQKDKLGLTALHIAAGCGNSQALEDLIREEPDCINVKTIVMETPLFFAVRNDHMVCAELLLRWGANSEVLNMRKERPVDFAKSQDMRFLLQAANTCHTNLASLSQEKQNASLESDEDNSETCEALLSMIDDNKNTESTKIVTCKYFESRSGCARGSKCFYVHDEEQLRKMNPGVHLISASNQESKHKVLLGGLPLSLDSDSLGEFFEKHFGPIENACIVGETQSKGFGSITFKHESSAYAAVQAHFATIMGKTIEIKSAILKEIPDERTIEEITSTTVKEESLAPKFTAEMPCLKITKEATHREKSWAGRLLHGHQKTSSKNSQAPNVKSFEEKDKPKWLRNFKKWFPRFLKDIYRQPFEGNYALSSLKTDFKAAYGLELDHASLGYPKLSDFMKTLPYLCHVKPGSLGKYGSPNHMVLVPSLSGGNREVLQSSETEHLSPQDSCCKDRDEIDLHDPKSLQDLQPISVACTIECKPPSNEVPKGSPAQGDTSTSGNTAPKKVLAVPRFSWSSNPGQSSSQGNDDGSGGKNNRKGKGKEVSEVRKLGEPQNHPVLYWLYRKWNWSLFNRRSYFAREFDFLIEYISSFRQEICFGCKRYTMQWVNVPCLHLLWCNVCKQEASEAAVGGEHLCVICDRKVEDVILKPNDDAFPPLSPSTSRNPSRRSRY